MSAKLLTLPCATRKIAAGRVRRARCALGLTQEQVAERCGVSVRTIRDIELGRVRMVALEVLTELEDLEPTKKAA